MRALEDVSFSVRGGEVHALMGENGAGKSTLLRILGGDHTPESGETIVAGSRVELTTPHVSLGHGIRVIYQEPNLVPAVTVAENLFVGRLPRRGLILDRPKLYAMAEREIERLGATFAPDDILSDLSTAQRQMVEIGKALAANARILALDEPSSSLSSREVDQLFSVIRRLRDDDVADHLCVPPTGRGDDPERPHHGAPRRPPCRDRRDPGDGRAGTHPHDGRARRWRALRSYPRAIQARPCSR